MYCPHCLVIEMDASGSCPRCGYRAPEESPGPGHADGADDEDGASAEGADAADSAVGADAAGGGKPGAPTAPEEAVAGPDAPAPEELPGWRKELSERLQAIKLKKEASAMSRPAASAASAPVSAEARGAGSHDDAAALRAEIMERMKVRKPAPGPPVPIPLQKKLEPLKALSPVGKPSAAQADPGKIRSIIDSAVSRKPIPGEPVASVPVPPAFAPSAFNGAGHGDAGDSEGKLILLSRTLSGLVDLICIVICAGIFVVAADTFSGILVLDSMSIVHFSILFLLTYFVYSVFFLIASSQTIGMMITDLHVVGMEGERPSTGQLLIRCGGFLVSLFGLGLGLLWSLASRENLCLHDRISGTRVVRI